MPAADLRLPVLAVGEATAAEARAHGFVNVTAAEGDAAALAALAADRLDPAAGPLLLAVGEGYGAELAAALRRRGFRVLRRVVYAAAPATALPEAARAALAAEAVVAALFFSPRSARCAISLLRAAGLAGAWRAPRRWRSARASRRCWRRRRPNRAGAACASRRGRTRTRCCGSSAQGRAPGTEA